VIVQNSRRNNLGAVPGQSPFSFMDRGPAEPLQLAQMLDASASSQSRMVTIFGSVAVAFGQMIQFVFERRNDSENGCTNRPLKITAVSRWQRYRNFGRS
jgi:hypothetical protein